MKSVAVAVSALVALAVARAEEPAGSPGPADKAPREFVIFFQQGGAWIPEEAQAVLPQIAEAFHRIGYASVSVGCYSDNVGSQDLNLALTKDRARRIKTELVRYKVPEGAVSAEGYGFADPVIEGMPLNTAVSNRRCVIKLS